MKIARIRTATGVLHAARQADGSLVRLEGGPFESLRETGEVVEGELLAPVLPPAIYCIGLNYRAHADETGFNVPEFPVVFMKAPTAVQNPGGPILLPSAAVSETVDYEAELAVVIGRAGRNLPRERALDHVLGYTCANDVSARNWQTSRGGGQYCRAKTFDTFCPLGPEIVTADEIPDPGKLRISSRVNGDLRQDSTTADMIFDVPALIEFLSRDTTLAAGTVILTGTPSGVGVALRPPRYLRDGDSVEITVEGIGTLINPVRAGGRA
ncbi:MAG: fumarylacetoacetate hydrolase family protein [Puniceicoccaceae bacterium]